MSASEVFFWGFVGSAATELLQILAIYYKEPIVFPERYRRKGFWLIRCGLALLGGCLAKGYGIQGMIGAIHVGAATPTILHFFATHNPVSRGNA